MKILLPINCSFNVKLYFSTNKAILIFKQPVVLNYGASVKAFKWNIGRQVCRAAHYIGYVDHAIDLCNTHTYKWTRMYGVKIFLTHANVCSYTCWFINRLLLKRIIKLTHGKGGENINPAISIVKLTKCVHFWWIVDDDSWKSCTYKKVKRN